MIPSFTAFQAFMLLVNPNKATLLWFHFHSYMFKCCSNLENYIRKLYNGTWEENVSCYKACYFKRGPKHFALVANEKQCQKCKSLSQFLTHGISRCWHNFYEFTSPVTTWWNLKTGCSFVNIIVCLLSNPFCHQRCCYCKCTISAQFFKLHLCSHIFAICKTWSFGLKYHFFLLTPMACVCSCSKRKSFWTV